jgi:hypothetical protein
MPKCDPLPISSLYFELESKIPPYNSFGMVKTLDLRLKNTLRRLKLGLLYKQKARVTVKCKPLLGKIGRYYQESLSPACTGFFYFHGPPHSLLRMGHT